MLVSIRPVLTVDQKNLERVSILLSPQALEARILTFFLKFSGNSGSQKNIHLTGGRSMRICSKITVAAHALCDIWVTNL